MFTLWRWPNASASPSSPTSAPCQIAPSAVTTIAYRLGLLRWSSRRSSARASRSYGNSGIRQRVEVTYAVYSAVNPASRPKIRNTPIRSWLPSVVRWRLISSFARVIADEKPMQYSVPLTSLSIVFGIAISGTPAVWSTDENESVSSPPIVTRWLSPRCAMVSSTCCGQVVHAIGGLAVRDRRRVEPGRQRRRPHLARVRARAVEHRAAGPVDRPRVVAVEDAHVLGVGLGAASLVGQALPAAADADDLVAELGGAVDDALDDRVEAGHVAAAREDSDASRSSQLRLRCDGRPGAGPPLILAPGLGCEEVAVV